MKKSTIKKYAKLIVRVGANVQKGQSVVVSCSVENAEPNMAARARPASPWCFLSRG